MKTLSLVLLFLGVVLARLPLIRDPIDVRPDGGEYLCIARHIAREGRWVSDIQWHFNTAQPVRHLALGDRPPLYPLVAAAAVQFADTPSGQVYLARLLNSLLAGLGAVLAWFLLAAEFGPPVAWVAVILFSLLPQTLRYGAQPLTEPLFLALLVAALLSWRRAIAEQSTGIPSAPPYARPASDLRQRVGCPPAARVPATLPYRLFSAAAGFFFGLLTLAHAVGLVAFLVVALSSWLPRARRRSPGSAGLPPPSHPLGARASPPASAPLPGSAGVPPAFTSGWLLLGFLVAVLPYWAALAWFHGSPLYSALRLNFSVAHIFDAIYGGYEHPLPSPAAFAAAAPGRVAALVARQAGTLGSALVETLLYLLPLALLARRRDLEGPRRLYLAIALALLLAHSLAWVTWGAARYLLPVDLFLIPLLLAIPLRAVSTRHTSQVNRQPSIVHCPSSIVSPREAEGREPGDGAEAWRVALAAGLLAALAAVQIAADFGRGEATPGSMPRWPWLAPPALGAMAVFASCLCDLQAGRLRSQGTAMQAGRLRSQGTGGARRIGWLLAASVALSAASAGRLTARLYLEKGRADRGFPDSAMKREAVRWVNENTSPGALVATNEPWILNLLTWRPAIVLPWLRDASQTERYLRQFRPACIILLVTDAPGERPEEIALGRDLGGWLPSPWRAAVDQAGPSPGQRLLIFTPR